MKLLKSGGEGGGGNGNIQGERKKSLGIRFGL